MNNNIISSLHKLESDSNIRVLYAVESGSRAWGFASEKSDYDVRFIYIHKPEWYLQLHRGEDHLEYTVENKLEMCGWDLQKTLQLFQKSNPGLLEWLRSPLIYHEAYGLAENLRTLIARYFQPHSCMFHYLHMAQGNFNDYLRQDVVRVKKYLYVLRPMLCARWIYQFREFPPLRMETLVDTLIPEGALRYEVIKLLERKRSGEEFGKGDKLEKIHPYLEEELAFLQNEAATMERSPGPNDDELNRIFLETLQLVWPNKLY